MRRYTRISSVGRSVGRSVDTDVGGGFAVNVDHHSRHLKGRMVVPLAFLSIHPSLFCTHSIQTNNFTGQNNCP